VTTSIEEPEFDLPPATFRDQWWLMIASGCVFVIAGLLTVLPPGERVAFKGFEDYPLPQSCYLRSNFNLDCAGCGLTRSTIYLTHGDWQASVDSHPLGWLIALLIAAQIPYRSWIIRTGNRYPIGKATPWVLLAVVGSLLMTNWLMEISRRYF